MANHQAHVAAAAERWPEAWRRAHTDGPGTEDFIRLLASFLHHEVDPNVGLNGKRGNPDDISDDALAVFDQSGDVTDRSGRRMIIVDCIVGAGGPDPRAGWASVGGPSPGAWVQPPRIHDAPPPGPGVPAPPATPDLAGLLKAIDAKLTTIAEHSGKQAATQERLAAALAELVTAVKALKP
jgi:hypothetical protein